MSIVPHDYHIHTNISKCAYDPLMTPENIVRTAEELGHHTVVITDHAWDERVPCEMAYPMLLSEALAALPLPKSDKVRVCFGVETEYWGGDKLGISPEAMEMCDHINIPISHFHWGPCVKPAHVKSPAQYAELLVSRLEELLRLDLPFEKVGIVHLTFTFQHANVDEWKQTMRLLDETRLRKAFDLCARRGVGIELNSGYSKGDDGTRTLGCWPDDDACWMRAYRFAAEQGCLFFHGSDAHTLEPFANPYPMEPLFAALGIDEGRLYQVK